MIKNIIKLILITVLIGSKSTYAQNTQQTLLPYWVEQDMAFKNLSKTGISVLYDRVHSWAGLPDFNAQQDTVSFRYAMQAWHELYLATYDRSHILSSTDIRQTASMNTLQGKGISIGYIDYSYHYIRTDAVDSGYLIFNTQDSLFYDGDKSELAYRQQRTILPIVASDKLEGGEQTFYFDPAIQLLNGAAVNQSVSIKISSGGRSITLLPGQSRTLDISVSVTGRPSIGIEVYITPGTSFTFPHHLFDLPEIGLMSSVTTHECHSGPKIEIWSGNDLTFKGYDESIATQGKGEYKIYYKMNSTAAGDCGDMRITKPIIVMDGFDPQDTRDHPDAIWDLFSYGSKHFGDDLRVEGHDVIMLNFPKYTHPIHTGGVERDGGADYIERNARVLIALINKVNDELIANGSSEKIVIIGPSMGGQITRYALKYMEDNDMEHNTRLFIAFDSPNHGANIPIGVQMAIFYSGYHLNEEETLTEYRTKLGSVAARQMLIHQLGVHWESIPIPGGADTIDVATLTNFEYFHHIWQPAINAMGYPENLRKVTLVNGNNSGQYRAGNSFLMHYTAHDVNTSWIGLGKVGEMKIRHLANSGTNEVFYFKKKYSSAFTHSYNNGLAYGNIDAAPGGTYRALKLVKDGLYDRLGHFLAVRFLGINVVADGKLDYYSGDNQCFMPIASTLGFKNPSFNWALLDINDRDLNCENAIEYDNYFTEVNQFYTDGGNGEHVQINAQSARWAIEEILYGKQGCPNICATKINQAGGDQFMCGTTSYTFNLDVSMSLSDAEILWEVPEGIVPLSTLSNTNSVTIRWDGVNTPEDKRIKVTIRPKMGSEFCGASKVITKELSYGKFALDYAPTSITDPQFTVWMKPYSAMDYQYSWKLSPSSSWTSLMTLPYRTFDKIPAAEAPKNFQVRVYPVGCSTYADELTGFYVQIGMGTDIGGGASRPALGQHVSESMMLSPNPTKDRWELTLDKDWSNRNIKVDVYNAEGKSVQSFTAPSAHSLSIDAASLAAGVYLIQINNGQLEASFKGVKL